MKWQRRARRIVGVFLVVFSVVVYFAIRPRETPERTAANLPRVDPAASGETAGGVWTFSHGETLRFERLLNYSDGRSRAVAVTLKVPEENGRVVTVTAREADQQEQKSTELGRVKFSGDVVVTTSDGLRLTTDEAVYNSEDEIVRAPGLVRFVRGRMSGSGQGATYDRRRDELWLLDQARVRVAPDERGSEGLDVTAGAAGLARTEHKIRFERGVHIERPDRDIDALAAVVTLTDDESKVSLVELRGDARIARRASAPPSPGELSSMVARDIDLRYADDGRTLQSATLVAGAALTLAGEQPGADRRVAAERLAIDLASDGSTVTALQGQEQVDLTLPATATGPARRIRSATLDARSTGGDGLRSAGFGGGVEYRETARAAGAADRVARSTRLEVSFQPGFGTIDAARFIGNVIFTDGEWRGQGPAAQYDPARGRLTLDAEPGVAALPQVADARVTIDGRRIELALDDRRLDAQDRVRSVMRPRESAAPGTEESGHMPALLTEGQPVFVTAARLAYDGRRSVAVYSGGARLWQDDTVIQAETISLDDQRGNLSASGKVHSVMKLATSEAGTPPRAPDRTVADAETLEYEDARRRATYRTAARVNGPAGDLRGERIELTLAGTEGRLDRVEAFESVTAALEAGRYTTTGSHLTYFVPEDRYVVEGAPVRVVERREADCLETVGTILTFIRSTDTINVEGTDGSRSRTRPVPCAERRH